MAATTDKKFKPDTAIDVFETSIGWFGILHSLNTIVRVKFGFESRKLAINACLDLLELSDASKERFALPDETDAKPWRELIIKYGEGEPVCFDSLEIETAWLTNFQAKVIDACRKIPRGQTITYGELANRAGSPGAARAAGSVMRSNRVPIVVPCHRVVGANGLGGFSASQGVSSKRQLLELENAIESSDRRLPLFDQ